MARPKKAPAPKRKPRKKAEPNDLVGLTYKERMFVAFYLGKANGNASEAARMAGYGVCRVRASKLLTKGNIRAAIDAKLDEVSLSTDEILARLSDMGSADMGEFIKVDKDGRPTLDLTRAKRAGKLHLIKSMKPTKFGLTVELHDSQAALEKLGRYRKLFVDRTEISGPDGASLIETYEANLKEAYGKKEP